MHTPTALDESTTRLVRLVDTLGDDDWSRPSLLPEWTRAHVVAHLALNAEGFARALSGLRTGEPVPVYDSDQSRDANIAELAAEPPATVRDRLLAATTAYAEAIDAIPPELGHGQLERVPGGPTFEIADLPGIRRREVEIHAADLGVGYLPSQWPEDFAIDLLDAVTQDHASSGSPGFTVRALDLDRTWPAGADTPVVVGTAADLGWWLTGRGGQERLVAEQGDLPELGPWRRTPAR